ncbi:hypothetical protein BJV78DRAFT_1278730 [Lactifluus subvellereus]|nr:hypothetical protein BJV78DRAFT_1278730 [Lactifluus subvellereus]
MHFRRHDTRRRAHAGGVHLFSSSASLSSFSSSTSSTLPAAPPSDSSHSDIAAFDRSLHSSPFSAFNNRLPPDTILPVTRSSSLYPTMGQSPSRSQQQHSADPPPSPTVPVTSGSAGSRLKRVFGGRRKKSEDVPPSVWPSLALPPMAMGKSRSATPSSSASSLSSAPGFSQQPSVSAGPGYPVSSFIRHVPAEQQSVPRSKPLPESPPPDPTNDLPSPSGQRSSVIIVPSSTPAALQNVSGNENAEDVSIVLRQPKKRDSDQEVMKDDWRKSDSTMTSYYTVRPRSGASGGTHTPRPVSMASLQSTSTVVPAGKRLSALLTEAEFIMTEEDMTRSGATTLSRKTSPSEPSKTRKSRSVSLSFTSPLSSNKPATATSASCDGHSSKPVFKHRPSGDVATLSKTAASGIIGPLHGGGSQSTEIRGNLAALSAAITAPPPFARPLPQQPSTSSGQHGSQRQPAITMTGGLVPAAGSAMGFGKRAVEFMGRAFGGLGHPSSSPSITSMDDLGRSASNVSLAPHASQAHTGKGKQRQTPNPSGEWIIDVLSSNSIGQTDSESFVVTNPTLGTCLRGPMMNNSGGLVFGRDLKTCVKDTAVDAVRLAPAAQGSSQTVSPILHERRLPALVVRCAEHLMKWGVEEEGLFRVSGRATHVAKLRAEFDTGADFDMLECEPGDLDPHAVASVFKTYLRELPEPILTHALNRYFEAAMLTETNIRKSIEEAAVSARTVGRPSLPSGPRDTSLRKRPSLTTLMLPNFSGMRPPSQALLNAFATLVARLPQENRDLLRTVIDLINFVAHRKEIRMPLSNLTLVLHPTLNMSPPVLRVLCEAESIWDGPPPEGWEDSTDLVAQRDIPDPVPGSQSPGRGLEQHVTAEDSSAQGDLDDQSSAMEGAWDTHTGVAQDDTHEDDKRLDDRASYFSAGDSRPSTPAWGKGSPLDPWSPPALTSSSDSLTTPSMSSEAPSIPQVTAPTPLHPYRTKENLVPSSIIPDFVRTSPVPSPQPASHPPPVSFPGIQTAPTTPSSHRFSTDLPLVRSESSSQSSRPPRVKRPSLTALFSKKSISSLRSSRLFSSSSSSSPYYDAEGSPSRSSPASLRRLGSSSPMISAPSLLPQRSSSSLPPLLSTAIDASSLSLAIGLKAEQTAKAERTDTEPHTTVSRESSPSPQEADAPLSSPRMSPITPVTSHSHSTSELPKLSLSKPEPLQPQLSDDSFVSVSSASYRGLSFLDDHIGDGALRDDWARNVFNDLGWSPTTVEHGMPGKT